MRGAVDAAHARAGRDDFRGLARRAKAWATRTCAGTWTTAAATTTAPARHGVGLGRHPLLRQPPRLPRAGRRRTANARRVLTWPEGNGWLARAWPRRWANACTTGRVVHAHRRSSGTASRSTRWTSPRRASKRWQAASLHRRAAAVHRRPRGGRTRRALLRDAARGARYAPWLVANLHLRAPLDDRPGAPPAWDNVHLRRARAWAMWMRRTRAWTRPRADGADLVLRARRSGARRQLLAPLLARWRAKSSRELSVPHPDLLGQAHAHRGGALRPRDGDSRAGRIAPGCAGRAATPAAWHSRTATGPAIRSSRRRSRPATGRAWKSFDEMALYGAKCAIEGEKFNVRYAAIRFRQAASHAGEPGAGRRRRPCAARSPARSSTGPHWARPWSMRA